ncbi:MAG: GntR family transcriptional regulator [Chloroflexi bacterium]|nr:MAG: GntR family transcriptional regulator [Chloroflexota bacterium]MBL1192956.1 GntR family transcriptional regulator [Chloroflexota bacterium]NOH10248.1 GntR family transcriptional regulator [Chloroflexota bacterium]
MNIEINFQSHVPIYSQVKDQIRHLINTGELQPGDQLPTVRQLAADLRVNFNTVARAYRQLDDDGIISTQHGRGTFILEPHSQKEAEQLRQLDMQRLTHYYLTEAHRLGFSPEEVRALFEEKFKQWMEDGEPPSEK